MSSRLYTGRPGEPVNVAVAAPGATTEWTYTLPANYRYRVKSIAFRFATAAAAGNRLSSVSATRAGAVYARGAGFLQAASLTIDYCVSDSPGMITSLQAVTQFTFPPVVLDAGDILGSDTRGMLAGDAYTLIEIQLERWAL